MTISRSRQGHNRIRIVHWLLSLALSMLFFFPAATASATDFNAGLRFIAGGSTSHTPSFHLWYPTNMEEKDLLAGNFRVRAAVNAPPASGKFPVIIMSIAFFSTPFVHRDLGAHFARAGFVVAIPRHDSDRKVYFSTTLQDRVNNIAGALERISLLDDISEVVNPEQLAGLGYSRGGDSLLAASGITPSETLRNEHCSLNGRSDPVFCFHGEGFPGTITQWIYSQLGSSVQIRAPSPALRFDVLILVAPEIAPLPALQPEVIENLPHIIDIHRFENDEVLRFPFHADRLHRELGSRPHRYTVHPDAHHFALIEPDGPASVTREEFPVGLDPPDFNRRELLPKLFNHFVDVLRQAFPAH